MFHPSRGAVKLTRRGRDDPSMARLPSSFSNHTSPHSTRGPSAFSVNGGEQLGVGGLNLTMPLGVLNFGPTFGSQGGRQTVLPPTRGARYQVLAAHHRHRRPCRGGDPDGRHRSTRRHEHRVEFVRSWAAREGLMRVDRSVVFGLRRLALNDSPVATRVARSRSDTGITQASYKRSGAQLKTRWPGGICSRRTARSSSRWRKTATSCADQGHRARGVMYAAQ